MYPALDGRLMGELSSGWLSGGRGRVAVRPGSDAEFFMRPNFGVLNRLRTSISIWNCSAVLPTYPGRECGLWSDLGTVLIQTPNIPHAEPNA